mmetsp:Transcript_27800/g.60770  ORF Transcript_27800/g.60770 Transcript_27800/m.60770 type:complete len:331 (+) Transcript_27800:44-1036(+)
MEAFQAFDLSSIAEATGGAMQSWLILLPALAIWYLEQRSRGRLAAAELCISLPSCGQALRQFAPEVAGVIACAMLGAILLSVRCTETPEDAMDPKWQALKAQWPLLVTADSLLAMQAMLRALLLIFAAFSRGYGKEVVPLYGEPAVLMLWAAICRVVLLVESPFHTVEGPLGGSANVFFEVLAVPLLMLLSRGVLSTPLRSAGLLLAALAAIYPASHNRLPVSGNYMHDSMFSFNMLLEVLAAAASVARTVAVSDKNPLRLSGFVRLLLPVQQGLAFYFALHAFPPDMDEKVKGSPVAMMQAACGAQVCIYSLGLVLHLALSAQETQHVA